MIVHPANVKEWGDVVRPWLDKALQYGYGESVDKWLEEAEQDQAQLWVSPHGAAVTRVIDVGDRILHIVSLGGGKKHEWLDEMVGEWKSFAKRNGCKKVIATGRPGWKKDFAKHGFSVEKITGVCEV